MHVLIATPTAGQLVTTAYTSSLINATRAMHAAGLDYHHSTFDGADIVMARNYLANTALQNPDVGHVLWIDSDMGIPLRTFSRMFAMDQPFVGVIYSERSLDLERYVTLRNAGLPEEQARALSTGFNVRLQPGKMTIDKGVCEVLGLGFGCVLTRRDLLQTMVEKQVVREVPSGKLKKLGLKDTMYDFFGEIRKPNGSYLSEDYSFCARVAKAGERVNAVANERLGHLGSFEYGASFLEHLKGREAAKKAGLSS